MLVEVAGARFLTDPLLRPRIGHVKRLVPLPDPAGLEPDAILISHAHHDHLDVPSLRWVARRCPVIVPRRLGGMLGRRGIQNVIEVDVGDSVPVSGVSIVAIPAAHDGRRYPGGRRRAAIGYLLEASTSVYFAGDTDLYPGMRELTGRVDVAALPIWGWGPRAGRGHLDPERAAEAAAVIRPRVVIPIHWGTLSVIWGGDGDRFRPARAFAEALARIAPDVEARVLAPGERTSL